MLLAKLQLKERWAEEINKILKPSKIKLHLLILTETTMNTHFSHTDQEEC